MTWRWYVLDVNLLCQPKDKNFLEIKPLLWIKISTLPPLKYIKPWNRLREGSRTFNRVHSFQQLIFVLGLCGTWTVLVPLRCKLRLHKSPSFVWSNETVCCSRLIKTKERAECVKREIYFQWVTRYESLKDTIVNAI